MRTDTGSGETGAGGRRVCHAHHPPAAENEHQRASQNQVQRLRAAGTYGRADVAVGRQRLEIGTSSLVVA